MAIITTRVDDKTKQDLKKIAQEIGIPVGSLFNARAKELIRKKSVSFSIDNELLEDQEMYANRDHLIQELKESVASGRSSLII